MSTGTGTCAATAYDAEARTEDVRWMAATGESLTGAARRLGLNSKALDKWCRRHGLTNEIAVLRSREPHDWNRQALYPGQHGGRWAVAS